MGENIMKGQKGMSLAREKLKELGVEFMETLAGWPVDIILKDTRKMDVKFAEPSVGTNTKGYKFLRWCFDIKDFQRDHCDFLLLICNTPEGFFYYIVPGREVTHNSIAFNPFSKRKKSKFLKYRDCWDLIFPLLIRLAKIQAELDYYAEVYQIVNNIMPLLPESMQ